MAKFQALELALELAREVGTLVEKVQQHDRDLSLQLRRAAVSVASCFSEGAQRAGRDRLQLYRTSGGSAAEVRTQLQIAVALRYVESDTAAPVIRLADRIVGIAWRLTHPR